MKEIKPSQKFYETFRLYKPDSKCECCGQLIKSKRKGVKFYIVGVTKSGMLRIKKSNTKGISTYHPDFFELN